MHIKFVQIDANEEQAFSSISQNLYFIIISSSALRIINIKTHSEGSYLIICMLKI